MSRIAVGGFLHETNSFVTPATGFAPFEQATEKPRMGRDAEMFARLSGTTFGIGGFLEQMTGHHELVPLVWASATAGSTVKLYVVTDERVSAKQILQERERMREAFRTAAIRATDRGGRCLEPKVESI